MRKDLTEVVFILDESGSMSGLEADTIGGFNSMLSKQRNEDGEAYISTVLFNHRTRILHDRIPINKVLPMNKSQYYVGGTTALLDAIGGAVHHISNVHKYIREEDKPEKTLFIIITDGMENSSHTYSSEAVKAMIEEKKNKDGWEFLFLGANIDAIKTASNFGISADRAIDYECDSEGTQLNYEVISETVSAVRRAESREELDEMIMCCSMPIREDYRRRHKSKKNM